MVESLESLDSVDSVDIVDKMDKMDKWCGCLILIDCFLAKQAKNTALAVQCADSSLA